MIITKHIRNNNLIIFADIVYNGLSIHRNPKTAFIIRNRLFLNITFILGGYLILLV